MLDRSISVQQQTYRLWVGTLDVLAGRRGRYARIGGGREALDVLQPREDHQHWCTESGGVRRRSRRQLKAHVAWEEAGLAVCSSGRAKGEPISVRLSATA